MAYVFILISLDAYIISSRILGHADLNDISIAAKYENSIFWTFLDRKTYYSKGFHQKLKIITLGFNFVHFFICQGTLVRCLKYLITGGTEIEINENNLATFIFSNGLFYI